MSECQTAGMLTDWSDNHVMVGKCAEVGALFTTLSSIRVSRVRVTLTVTVRVSRVSVMVSGRDSVK